MKSQQEAKQLQEIEAELQQKDTTFERELTKQIQEKKTAPIKAMEEVRYEVELPEQKSQSMPKMAKKAAAKAQRLPKQKFGIETIRVPREGVYEINIDALLQKRPIIVLEKGRVYFIHLPSVFEKVKVRE
jgi:predicted  nucleic acid-binding Zn-ribbon protein